MWEGTTLNVGDIANGELLPVTYAHFTAKPRQGEVLLDWATASESGNEGFEVQHSSNGRQWSKLGFVPGYGTTEEERYYGYTHPEPAPGINYYRLRQVDFDGAFEFSEIVSVRLPEEGEVAVFPNPTSGAFWIELPEVLLEEDLEVEILDGFGRSLWREQRYGEQGQLGMGIPEELPAGYYLVRLRADGRQYQARLLKK